MHFLSLLSARLLCLRNQRLGRTQFEHRRLRRFRRFAQYACLHSPYYRQIASENKIDFEACLPEDFPILTKRELLDNFDEIITLPDVRLRDVKEFLSRSLSPEELLHGRYVVLHTSGSSGEVAYFVYDGAAWARGLAQLLNSNDFSLLPGKRNRTALYGATEGHFAGISIAVSAKSPPLNLLHTLRYFEINRPLPEIIRELNEYQPNVIGGYATGLKVLAESQLSGDLRIRPQGIHSSGEPLLDTDREIIERAFGRCVRNQYVSSEHMFMGMKEPGWRSMRLLEDELIFEIHPRHTLVTNLFNRALPLIRYRMNDVLSPVQDEEHRPYRAISEIVGRVEQSARFLNQNGTMDAISPHTINEIMIPHVRRFQLRVTDNENFTFFVVFHAGATEMERAEAHASATAKLRAILRQKHMNNVNFNVLVCDDLPHDPLTRKFRLIVDACPTAVTPAARALQSRFSYPCRISQNDSTKV